MVQKRIFLLISCFCLIALAGCKDKQERRTPTLQPASPEEPSVAQKKPSSEAPVASGLSKKLRDAIRELNPEYSGKGMFQSGSGGVYSVNLAQTGISRLDFLKGMEIRFLDVSGNKITDLAPLAGLPLSDLDLSGNPVQDITPLKGMPIQKLILKETRVSDIGPLKGMPLTELDISATPLRDISPLTRAPLRIFTMAQTQVSDLSPLAQSPLDTLSITGSPVIDLAPLSRLPIQNLNIAHTKVTNAAPLKPMKLRSFIFTPASIKKDILAIRTSPTMRLIGTSPSEMIRPNRFWFFYDQGQYTETRY